MRKILYRQGYHLLAYIVLGALLVFGALAFPEQDHRMGSLSAFEWILLSWILAGLFQAWIMLFWRLELYYGTISKRLGKAGFLVFRVGFIALGSLRFLTLIPIARLTAAPESIPDYVTIPLIVATTPFILWGLYSVFFYFGANRAFGADHFDPAYRNAPLETRGIFKYIPNSMYTVILIGLYHPGLFFHSPLGLIAAAAHHALVWTHYFCTEKPDMQYIYGSRNRENS